MNQHTKQQNLELFIQEVINYLKKNFNYTKEEINDLLGFLKNSPVLNDCLQERKEIWEQYMKDFSPEITAQGIASGLI